MSEPCALFAIPTLHLGGAQRVFLNVLNGLVGRGVQLHLAAVQADGPFRSQLSPEINVHALSGGRVIAALPQLHSLIRRLRPDAVVTTAFRMNLGVTLMRATLPRRTRFLIREVNLFHSQVPAGWRGAVLTALAALAFRRADVLVCQSEFMAADLQRSLGLPAEQMRTILNPVGFDELSRQATGLSPFSAEFGPHVLAVGRLSREKGFDRLLSAFPALRKRRPEAQLWIVGDGPERTSLFNQAVELQIADGVHFMGAQENPYRWMRHADLMVVPSRHEGTPNTLLEAIACECPLVVLDHPGGTREMMRRTGQEWRVVNDLHVWNDAWFARPSPSVLVKARALFALDVIVREYLDAMRLLPQPAATMLTVKTAA
jgi:glycosyltransferase involved in cell wall biosynthesis